MTDPTGVDLVALDAELAALSGPSKAGALLALPIGTSSASRLVRGPNGEACVLIAGAEVAVGSDLKLRNVEAKARVRCEIESPDGSIASVEGALVTCTATDPQLRRLFLGLMEEALAALGDTPSASAIAAWLYRIATLFAKLEQEGRKRLRGLWAELLVMLALDDSDLAARRWHADPSERFDFLGGSFAIEVKSCQDMDRVHQFSLEQLRPPADLEVWVASVVVRADPQGESVLDLLSEIEESILDARTRDEVRAMALTIGGSALEDDDLHRFDKHSALSTLRLIATGAIPSITGPLPNEVLAVSLQVRCRDLPEAGTVAGARTRIESAPNEGDA
jgi:hypothetical protein